MIKIINEPAKAGSSNPGIKTGFRIRNHYNSKLEDSPKRISISQCRYKNGFSKEKITTLQPLRRFLMRNINRPWDKIYSNFCRRIDKRNFVGNRALNNLKSEVLTDCVIGDDGKIYAKPNYGRRVPVRGFYVHPLTKLLQWAKPFRYQVEKPTIAKIEFVSSVEILFWGKDTKFPYELIMIRKIKKPSLPSPLYSKRYAKTVLEKEENGWQMNYHEFYDPEEIVYRYETPNGPLVKRRKDCSDLPATYVAKTKTTLNSKEVREINRLLSLPYRE
ncbi:MAG: hypothetical protein A2817_01525 [Candidatus Yanofskybacteria bacterium RIFCSPHIGHO2_01_FULL_39_8b]|uniref:Uncharacterized protein n=1 Tax=Candidatus Yanofskybacteria bacterium RIFCSPHIGHO2_01_FULL_39_8b TaxID=1802659 RepID=A0A1F8EAP6_9BACT|nr:MAG: hypothetical protein A2817_01525 [Candidatus Yanofskybacteria bacterium RIFCSPHIGHO2_01_FULL_39_8b]